jgi:nucleoid DNA-binding protein
VQLGDWGSFNLTCNSEGKDTKGELNARAVKGLNIRFKPGKALREALSKATFVFAEDLVSKQGADTAQ